jgi:ABC-2 type transport system permease protein
MTATPGTTWWLLQHEVRMYFSGLRKVRADGKIRSRWLKLVVLALIQVVLHWVAYHMVPKLHGEVLAPRLDALLSLAALALMISLMLATALRGSVSALFDRGDLDLLLSSPLPAGSIFFARLLGIVVSVAGMFLFVLAPFANMGCLAGHPGWLAIYVVVVALAMLTSSAAMLLTLGLVRLLGARRTKVLVQVLSAVSGALIFLASQLAGGRTAIGAWLQARLLDTDWPVALWFGHALLGRPQPLLITAAAGLALFFFTTRFTRKFFVRGVQQAAGSDRAARAPRGGVRFNFRRGFTWAIMVKEWRLIARDTRLLSQVLLRLLYLVPLGLVVFNRAETVDHLTGCALVFVAASLAGALAWIIVVAEDAPDLLASAPRRAGVLLRAKLAAAVTPAVALVAAPALWLAVQRPLMGTVIVAGLLLATVSTACIVMWSGRPGTRDQFNRHSTGGIGGVLQSINGMAWCAAVWLLLSGFERSAWFKWSPAAVGVALVALAIAWQSHRRKT